MYKLIIKMAWKNSFLRLPRTLLVITMIAVSMSMMLGIQGLYDGMAKSMVEKSKRSDSGDISIYAKEYRVQKDLKYRIKDATKIQTEILNMPSVEAVRLRIKADGLASTARKSSFASIIGIDLDAENHFGNFSEFLKEGDDSLEKKGSMIGIELAKKLKVKIGSKIIFSTQDIKGEINSVALKVSGIVQTTNIGIDNSAIFIDIKKLHSFLGTSTDEATQIAIKSEGKELYNQLTLQYLLPH